MITDDLVFSIIQMTSNSVENLQPENISVVDTEGRLLSGGVLERMAEVQRQMQLKKQRSYQSGRMVSTMPAGKIVVPTVSDIVDWFEVKNSYERLLETKAMSQLLGVLPEGSYKVAVTLDMKSLKNSGAPDIKRISASIVIDSAREDVVLDEFTKRQIRNAVSGAIGFVEERDELVLSRAAFVDVPEPKVDQTEEILVEEVVPPAKGPHPWMFIKYWPLFIMGATILGSFFGIRHSIRAIVRRFKTSRKTSCSCGGFYGYCFT